MTTNAFKSATKRLAAADLTDHLTMINEAKRQSDEIQTAIDRGMDSVNRLTKELNDVRAGRPIDADAAADALISGESIALEARSAEQIQADLDGTRVGLTRLRERKEEAARAELPLKSDATGELAACVDEVPQALLADAQRAVETLASIFAAT